jgi:hypothetical protein
MTQYKTHVDRHRTASDRLLQALAAHGQALKAYESARNTYDDRRQALVLDGIPGLRDRCPSDVREAALCRELAPQINTMRTAREHLHSADVELESAKVQERTERETLRAFQLTAAAT